MASTKGLTLPILLTGYLLLISLCEIYAITHVMNLLWSEKDLNDGAVDIKGIPGDPADWVNKTVKYYSISYYSDDFSRRVSRRIPLGFDYGNRRVFFSDGGFKQMYGITLADTKEIPYTYNVTMHTVYTGVSSQVNGLAVDWLSNSIYWTDALYEWIIVANSTALNVYNHLIVVGLDKPMGIAVYPQRGLMFWTDLGAVPKIERASLAGENRTVFVNQGIDRPMGLTIDYLSNRLYWVDDARSSIECIGVDGGDRMSISLVDQGILGAKLFGIATFRDYIFIADQTALSIRVFNMTTTDYISQVPAGIFAGQDGIPYDVMMYDEEMQILTPSDCSRLACEDMCISEGGSSARCMCRDGFILSPVDGKSCIDDGKIKKPQYLYSVGESLCATNVNIADLVYAPFYVDCFWNSYGHRMTSLGFHNYAELVFFSDEIDRAIHRIRLDVPPQNTTLEVLVNNIGSVKGVEVDWIGDNLYYLNSDSGSIIVSQLTGRYPNTVVSGIVGGKSLGVNPLSGTLYWATNETIYVANLDGSNIRQIVHISGAQFDGMVLDIRQDVMYWVDDSLPGIRSSRLNGSGVEVILRADGNVKTFHDVTVYKNYLAWTDGNASLYFAARDYDNSSVIKILRGIRHTELAEERSHDIVTYDEYLQPLFPPNIKSPCDVDDDRLGCSQLCLLLPGPKKVCGCSYGYTLASDGRTCVSELLKDNFLIFIDGSHKAMYQLSFLKIVNIPDDDGRNPQDLDPMKTSLVQSPGAGADRDLPQGLSLEQVDAPTLCAYDIASSYFYWFDQDSNMNAIKRKHFTDKVEHTVTTLVKDINVKVLETISTTNQLIYTDSRIGGGIYLLDPVLGTKTLLPAAGRCNPTGLAIEQISGDIYWVDASDEHQVSVYKCNMSERQCLTGLSARKQVLIWNLGSVITGLAIDVLDGSLIIYTKNTVYRVASSGALTLLANLDNTDVNFTSVAVVGDSVFYTDWSDKAVYKYDTVSKRAWNVTDSYFSRLTDLKAYRAKEVVQPPPIPKASPSRSVKSAIIGGSVAGGGLLLLLLLVLLILLVFLARRKKPPPYKTEAHDNPTYMTHSQVQAVVAAAGGLQGATGGVPVGGAYVNEVEKDKKALEADCCKVEPSEPAAEEQSYYPWDRYDTVNSIEKVQLDEDEGFVPGSEHGSTSEPIPGLSEIAIGFPRHTMRQNSNLSVTYSPTDKSSMLNGPGLF